MVELSNKGLSNREIAVIKNNTLGMYCGKIHTMKLSLEQSSSHIALLKQKRDKQGLTAPEKQIVDFLLKHLLNNYGFKLQGTQNA